MKRLRACGALITGGPAGLMPAIALAGAERDAKQLSVVKNLGEMQ
jgi:hypothetical protein